VRQNEDLTRTATSRPIPFSKNNGDGDIIFWSRNRRKNPMRSVSRSLGVPRSCGAPFRGHFGPKIVQSAFSSSVVEEEKEESRRYIKPALAEKYHHANFAS
jgi:hypothetical protein